MTSEVDQMTENDSLIELLAESLPQNETDLFKDEIDRLCSAIILGDQFTRAVPKIDLHCRERAWLYRLASELVDQDGVQRSPEQRQTEIGYRVIDLAFWFGITKGYELCQASNYPSGVCLERLWRHR